MWSHLKLGQFPGYMVIFESNFMWYGSFLKWWYPQNTPTWSLLGGKTLVVGYHHFRKPPYGDMVIPRVFGKWWSELVLQKKQTHFETYIDYHIQIISVKDNSVLTKACWYDFNTAWSHFLVAISKTNEKLGFPMKASLLFCDLTCACVALLHSAASKSHNSRSAFCLIPAANLIFHFDPSLGRQFPFIIINGLLQWARFLPIHRAAHGEAGAQDLLGGALELLGQAFLSHLSANVQENLSTWQPIAELIQKKVDEVTVTFWKQTPQNKQTWLNHC